MGCIADTLVLTQKGIIKIDDIVNKKDNNQIDLFESFDINDKKDDDINSVISISRDIKYDNFLILEKQDIGERDTLDITTSMGHNICGTYEHQIVVIDDNGNLKFKKLENISRDDYIAICYNMNIFNDKLKLNFYKRHGTYNPTYQTMRNYDYMNESIARLLGYIISEGNAKFENEKVMRFYISNYEKEIHDDIVDICKYLGLNATYIYDNEKNEGNPIGILISSILLSELIYYLGYKHLSANKEIPWSILQSNKECQINFIRSLFDGDGTVYQTERHDQSSDRTSLEEVVGYGSTSYKLCRQLQIMLLNMGLITRLNIAKGRYKDNTYESYLANMYGGEILKFSEIISFGLKRKIDTLKICIDTLKDRERFTNIIYPHLGNKINVLNEKLKQKAPVTKRWQEDFEVGGRITRITRQKRMTYNQYLEDIGLRRYMSRLIKGERVPTKQMLDRVLSVLEPNKNEKEYAIYLYMKKISDMFIFDKVKEIRKGRANVYNLNIDNVHSYIGNCIINR